MLLIMAPRGGGVGWGAVGWGGVGWGGGVRQQRGGVPARLGLLRRGIPELCSVLCSTRMLLCSTDMLLTTVLYAHARLCSHTPAPALPPCSAAP